MITRDDLKIIRQNMTPEQQKQYRLARNIFSDKLFEGEISCNILKEVRKNANKCLWCGINIITDPDNGMIYCKRCGSVYLDGKRSIDREESTSYRWGRVNR